jgi:hypothetical protein
MDGDDGRRRCRPRGTARVPAADRRRRPAPRAGRGGCPRSTRSLVAIGGTRRV